MGLINERHFEIEGFRMREYQRKRRFIASLASLSFFIAASFCFGFLIQSKAGDTIFGFHISEDGPFSWLNIPFFEAKAESTAVYPNGNVINNVLLVNLRENTDPWLSDDNIATANSILNGEGETLQAYIKEISYGNVNVESTIYRNTSDGNDGYIPSEPASYYITEANGKSEADLEDELLKEIIQKAQNDFAHKTKAELDTNNDGYLDNITFVIRGNKDDTHTLLWPHQFSLKIDENHEYPSIATLDGSLQVKDYNVILSGGDGSLDHNQPGIFNANNSDLGVIAHEYLHVYGFPDLYHNYKYDEESKSFVPRTQSEQIGDPLGKWDIMDNTNAKLPQYPLVYTNLAYSPWKSLLPELTTIQASTQNVTLHKVKYDPSIDTIAAMIKVDASINTKGESEYFMVEYRKKEFWDAELPGSGLLVYRINTAANTGSEAIKEYCTLKGDGSGNHCGNMFGEDEVFIYRPNPTSPATGNTDGNTDRNLENAAFTSGSFGKSLEEVSEYQANTFGETIYFSDGSNSGIVLSNIKIDGDEVSFDVEVPESTEDHDAPVIDEATGNGINGKWINGAPRISVHVSDVGHGIQEIKVTSEDGELVGGSDAHTYTKNFTEAEQVKNTNFEFVVKENGTYTITAKDFDGNLSKREIKVEYIDQIAPVIDAGKITITSTKITMPVTFRDDDSKINEKTAFYTTLGLKDATDRLVYDQPITDQEITLAPDFQGKVCITVKDNAGNSAKDPSCWVISDDKTAPEVTTTSNIKEDTWTAEPVKVSVNATDKKENDTGISYIEVTTSDGVIDAANERHLVKDYGTQGTQEESYTFEVKSNGTYTIKVCDYASKCSEDEVSVHNIDLAAPVITAIEVTNTKKMALFSTSAHDIKIIAHDEPVQANSGLREIRYQLVEDAKTYDKDVSSSAWRKADMDEILHTDETFTGTLYAYAVDNVGNVSKVFEKKIERISNPLVNDAFKSGIQDKDKKVNIIGISDPDVTIALQDVDLEEVKTKIGADYLSTHVLQNVYDISLLKLGSPYTLNEEITVRFAIDDALQADGSLKVIALDDDGNISDVDATLGDGYIEFKTKSLSLFATITSSKVSEKVSEQDTSVVSEAGPQTGDETTISLYIIGMLTTIAGISFLTYRHRLD